MLSQVRRRFFRRSVLGVNFVENSAVFPSLAYYSSKDDDEKKYTSSGGVSEPMRKTNRPTEADKKGGVNVSLFDEIIEATSAHPKRVNFKNRNVAERPTKLMKNLRPGQLNVKMVQAAKDVASAAGLAKDEVMDDLLGKLDEVFKGADRHHKKIKRKPSDVKQSAPRREDIAEISSNLFDATLMSSTMAGESKSEPVDTTASLDSMTDIPSELFNRPMKPAKMDKRTLSQEEDIMELVLNVAERREGMNGSMLARPFSSIEELLNSETPMDIFSSQLKEVAEPTLKFWQSFEEKELRRITRFAPMNWFDQCTVWTEEGKLWKFPIDNEQGMDEEAKVDFTEHVFLDSHIESWCPKDGPIKHFMELVTVGLSKNPFLTVTEKKDALEWYHQYFMKHRSLLVEIDAFGSPQNPIPVEGKVN